MPKKQIDYQNTIIYKLVCKDLNIKDLYVGHTTNFKQRKAGHKVNCNNQNYKKYNFYVYKFIRENGGWDNWNMIEIEKCSCVDFNEATKRERYWIENLNAILNCKIPTRTKVERYEENKEEILEKQKEYYRNNIEEKKQYYKEYCEKNKEFLAEKSKVYREKNKEEINKRKKEYYEKNKEKILKRMKEKIECPCSSIINKCQIEKHKKTKKHQEWEKKNE